MRAKPITVGLPTQNTVKALNTLLAEDLVDFDETTDPVEMLYAELVASGMNMTHAYCQATGRPPPASAAESRSLSPRRDTMTRKPGVRKMIQRLMNERAETTALRGAQLRALIEELLVDMATDDMAPNRERLAAADRLAKLTHVQAFAPPVNERESDERKTSAEIFAEIKKLIRPVDAS